MQLQKIFESQLTKKSVFRDRNFVSQHFMPKNLPFREGQIKEISENFAIALRNEKPNNIFIYGKVGTGKTVTSKLVLEQLVQFSEQKGGNVKGCYINCRNHSTKYKVLIKAVSQFYSGQEFMGFSAGFVYEKLLEYVKGNEKGNNVIMVLDEVDKVKDLDELIYSLSRANDELERGSISILGISNNLMFKENLDVRTKSSLCEREIVFPAYNAEELKSILDERCKMAFNEAAIEESAIKYAAAIAANESGDARKALMLLQRAGEIADKNKVNKVVESHVKKAKSDVEEEIILSLIDTLPEQEKLVLYAIAVSSIETKPLKKISGEVEKGLLYSGEVYNTYCRIAKKLHSNVVTVRWYREYISELEVYGLILTSMSGKGFKGQTRFIKMAVEAKKVKDAIEKAIGESI